jgi:hypothetical protein
MYKANLKRSAYYWPASFQYDKVGKETVLIYKMLEISSFFPIGESSLIYQKFSDFSWSYRSFRSPQPSTTSTTPHFQI